MSDFGFALHALRLGQKVARAGWNGRDMWLALQVPDSGSKMTLPYIYMRTVSGDLVPWLASQTDLLSEDWASVALPSALSPQPPREPIPRFQAPGDPRPVSERPAPEGPSIKLPLKEVQGPVGPGDDGRRMVPDLSQADEIIRLQLTKAWEASNPSPSEMDRVSFQGNLPIQIQDVKDRITQMVAGAVEAARQNPEAEKITGQVRI